MNLEIWFAYMAATLLILIIPGPTILLVISYALGQGRRTAFAIIAGVALGDLIAMSLSLAGLGALLLASAPLFMMLKWAGALYLAYMGVQMIRNAGRATARIESLSAKSVRRAGFDAFLVTLLNPKSIGFFVAFVPHFIEPATPLLPQFAVMVATFVLLGAANALAYATLAIGLHERLRKPAVLALMQRLGGFVLIAMAAFTAFLRRA